MKKVTNANSCLPPIEVKKVRMSPKLALVSFSQNLCISIAPAKQSYISCNNNL